MISPPEVLMLFAALMLGECSHAQEEPVSSPFEYREVYLPELDPEEGRPLQLNSVNRDWGIWGHNLAVVLPGNASQTVYARQGSGVNKDQFCFSSDALFNYIKRYINNNFGADDTYRFAILPNDNSVVCMCSRCVECGNTENDASGAVYYMLDRLSEEFPDHIFFTSYYRTAKKLPQKPLPENAGVLISSMSYPLCASHTRMEDDFAELLRNWAKFTSRIYVWDYINNFDDYLTPIPIFDIIQHRLQLYARNGVTGVFFNGSGTDYSTMCRLKTHVLAALLSDPEVKWRPLLRDLCNRFYPVTGGALCDFMIGQEDLVSAYGKTLPLYGGVPEETRTYLPVGEFIQFHDYLLTILPRIKDPERSEVQKMCRAMMFTHLELKRMAVDTVDCRRLLLGLERSIEEQGIVSYSESGGSTATYISDFRYMLDHYEQTGKDNLLRGVRLQPLTALDEEYNDISILTDGLLGLPSSYHCGQMISSADPVLRIAIPHVKGMKRIRVCMTRNAIYHIAFPLSVSLSVDGNELGKVVPKPSPDDLQRSVVEFKVPSNAKGTLVLTIVRNKEERTMALDEIEGF